MKPFFEERPQLIDLALAIGFFAGLFGLLNELIHETRMAYGLMWGCLMATSGLIQGVRTARAAVRNPKDLGGGLI